MHLIKDYLIVLMRLVTIMALFLGVALILGKRHIGELSVFDFITAVTLGSVAGADLADPEVPHGPTIMAIIGIGLLHVLLSRLIIKNRKAGHYLTFDPTIVIQHGVIVRDNLTKVRYSVDELLTHLRDKDVFDLDEVDYAILEPSGILSVLKKTAYKPATHSALGLNAVSPGLSLPVILEGKTQPANLTALGLDEAWLQAELCNQGYTDAADVFIAMANSQRKLSVSPQDMPGTKERLDH